MRFYGILCTLVALALLLTPAIAMKGGRQDEETAAADVRTEQTTVTADETAERVTTDGE